jgi:CRP-like cAMP-binding protein
VFRQGSAVVDGFTLEIGEVHLIRNTRDGNRVVLHRARRGEALAEDATFSGTYSSDGLAISPVRIRAWPRQVLFAAMAKLDHQAVLRSTLDALHHARTALQLRDNRSATDRLAAWLSLHATGEPPIVVIEQTWTTVADEVGLRREVVYRVLAEFERTGRIRREGTTIHLLRLD